MGAGKDAYEARRAARRAEVEKAQKADDNFNDMIASTLATLDTIADAVVRIADAVEKYVEVSTMTEFKVDKPAASEAGKVVHLQADDLVAKPPQGGP